MSYVNMYYILLLLATLYNCSQQRGRDARRHDGKRRDGRGRDGIGRDGSGRYEKEDGPSLRKFFRHLKKANEAEDTIGSLKIGRASTSGCCVDRMGNCKFYKSYCKGYAIVRKNCPDTCDACEATCEDRHQQCETAKRDGYCEMSGGNGIWARNNCQKSCDLCTVKKYAKCGVAPLRGVCPGRADRIVSGKEAKQGYYPWQAAIYQDDTFLCGGSLVGKRHILSAAHCFKGSEHKPWVFRITLGEHNRDYPIGVEQKVDVTKITIPTRYDRLSTMNDIAILEMKDDAVLSEYIRPICLPYKGEVRKVGLRCQVTGWGKMYSGGDSAMLLQEISVPIVDQATCKRINDKPQRKVTEGMTCTGYYDGYTFKSACHGDSGGPLSCYQGGRWKLFGIVSWGSPVCNALEAFNVFTKVSAYIPWIKENMK